MISYEFPLNEKVRTLLRLEDLFARVKHFIGAQTSSDHHVAITTLFEVLEVISRADLKSELLQELERQRRTLSQLHNNPQISEHALNFILEELDTAMQGLQNMHGKTGQYLRENEWLMSIKQRACVPGGTCEFDLPSYHYWQQQHCELRQEFLSDWLRPLLPIHQAIKVLLKLLRESGKVMHYSAQQGMFQQMQGGRTAQLLRVNVAANLACIPEVSANKYAINIRFINADYAAKSSVFQGDVGFELIFCSLAL
ncbi:MAG: cell division protein ZapD [Sideroxydans sp.]|nr:cell division protein ZapD [Sideroxydans sp.]